MATIGRKAYTQALATGLSTELNALANATYSAASATIDNSTNLDLYIDLLLSVTYGTAPSAGGTVDLYVVPSLDNTTFADGGGSTAPAHALLVGSFELRAVTTAQNIVLRDIPLPQYAKLVAYNNAGQAMAATGNTVKYRTYSMQSV